MTLNITLQALSDPTRRKILELLKNKDLAAGEIARNFNITLPSLSHHLNVLKQADLASCRRQGQEIIYSLNLSVFEEVAEKLIKFFSNK
ncbi:MAG: autorepressor SdpR family transcription factor [bacterium]|nr:autorepressor SdpR family transcription factor [bacterium]